jgi:pimeloyl-ACP methyl ester carboxylesterase
LAWDRAGLLTVLAGIGRETWDMECRDWGERSPRWAGISSQTVEVCGRSVHFLTADATRPEAPTHLLIHGMTGSATNWLDTVRPLTARGQVIAPDLPGTLAGHTASPHRSAARAEINARFLRAFTARLGLRDVVAHGWSMGGLVTLLFADLAPERVGGLVLVAPTLPGPLSATQALGWQTLGRLAVSAGSPALRGLLRLTGRRLLELSKRRYATPEALSAYCLATLGADPSRLSHDITALWAEELDEIPADRMPDAVTAFASAVRALYVRRRPVREAIDRVSVPTLLLWGDRDPLIGRPVIDDLAARRPDWSHHVVESVGHLLPLEVASAYADVVGQWWRQVASPRRRPAARPRHEAPHRDPSGMCDRRHHHDGLLESGERHGWMEN